ncbi:hypothetical protein EOW65_17675 [Sinirhodobacter ferrireducens]|uniref:Uncharacterized protein n=1 Tax=Paenirhodobacter ferrireducens TaxID=1215032 RepID=A0A443L720_9RHOB|nr:hypothetical protein [Sinirhodobacter ferrireducens]RWR44974.1 hypothetical protein EOW65_17675 [Sinirhodobacter ferrireducens]
MRAFRSKMFTPEHSAEECIRLWPTVMIRVPMSSQDWAFAEKIELQAMRPGWDPSASQLTYMRKLVRSYVSDGVRLDPDFDFSERDGL